LQVSAGQIGATQECTGQIGATQVSTFKTDPLQVGSMQSGRIEMPGSFKISAPQISSLQGGLSQVDLPQISLA
jgi:hypothetical protein